MGQRLLARVTGRSSIAATRFVKGMDFDGESTTGLNEPYRRSAWVQGAIKKISGPVASVAVDFYAADAGYEGIGQSGVRRHGKNKRHLTGKGRVTREQDAVVEIPVMQQFLRCPMKRLGWSDFVEATIGWRKMAGESFWLLTDSALLPFPEARAQTQVMVARPDRMRHVVEDGEIAGWVFQDGRGRQWPLLPEQVIHLPRWNPYDDFRGLSEYESARIAAESDWLAGKFAKNLMANNGDTGPYLVAKNGIPSDDQRMQILADLRSKRAAQQRGDFKPVFLTGDISIEDPQVRSVDAAYIAGRIENRHEVAIAFGVPPSMFDVKAAYSIGSASDFYQLILNTCVPEGDKICDGLVQLARRLTGKELEAFLDWDEHPVLQEVRKERLASVDTLWSKGVPMAQIDEYLGLGLPDYEGKDVGYLPFSVSPVMEATADDAESADGAGPAADPATDPALGEAEDVAKGLRAAFRAPVAVPEVECDCCGWDVESIDTRGRDPKEVAHWKDLISKRRATVRGFEAKFRKELMKARTETLRKLEVNGPILMSVTKAAAGDFIFDLAKFKDGLLSSMRGTAANALQAAGEQLFAEIGKDEAWRMPAPKALEFLKGRENKLTNVADQVHGQVMSALGDGLKDGDTLAELAGRVRAQFNNISDKRAQTIARTETSAAFGVARDQAMSDAGIQFKRWLTSGNSNVRTAHKLMNGAIVPISEDFTVIDPKSGEVDEVSHPGDPQGAPWNVINCACVSVPEVKGEAKRPAEHAE